MKDGECAVADENIEVVYLHDDNLGPNARFRVVTTAGAVSLVPASPEPRRGKWPSDNPTKTYHEIVPTELVVAVHPELRTNPLELQRAAVRYAAWLPSALDHESKQQGATGATGMVIGSRFIRLRHYVERELASALRARPPAVLSRSRLALWEEVAPMSLHVGLVRVSLGAEPMMDILSIRPTAIGTFNRQPMWRFNVRFHGCSSVGTISVRISIWASSFAHGSEPSRWGTVPAGHPDIAVRACAQSARARPRWLAQPGAW